MILPHPQLIHGWGHLLGDAVCVNFELLRVQLLLETRHSSSVHRFALNRLEVKSEKDIFFKLLLKAGCAPCLAGCRWYGICTKWVENLLFEVISMAFSSVFRPETWRTLFFHQKTQSGGQKRRFLRKMCYLRKGMVLFELFPLIKGGAGHIWAHKGPYGPIWARKIPKNT